MPADSLITTLQEWTDISMRSSMHNFLRYARASGFSMSHLGALFHIHHIGSCGVTEIGDHLGVTSAAASQLLERLVQQDLILRTEDPGDRRVKQIVLTEKGHRILAEGIQARQSWMEALAGDLSKPEAETVQAGLKILIEKLSLRTQPVDAKA